jgi:peptide/nickel transport system permease protein
LTVRRYVIRRLVLLLPTVLGSAVLTFVLVHFVPGDPVVVFLGRHVTPDQYAQVSASLGLDKPLPVQFVAYVGRLLRGDWGTSVFGSVAVLPLVVGRFLASLQLVSVAMLIAVSVGVALGVISAVRRNTVIDGIIRAVTLFAFSMPTFWLGLLLVLVFAVALKVLPAQGSGTPAQLILPAVALSASSIGIIARVTRASVLDSLNQDFVVTALAKGLGSRRVLLRHVVPNSLVPVIAIVGLEVGAALGGTAVTETVFNYPGLGQLLVNAIFSRDYPTIQGAALMGAMAFMVVSLIADLLYVRLDPRVAAAAGASIGHG